MSPIIAAIVIACTSPHVHDGDTITCAGTVIRIFGINSPEVPPKPLEPGGYEARARMLQLTLGQQVTCAPAGNQHDRYGRTVAKCSTPSTPDLGAEMIRGGFACEWIRYSHGAYGRAHACNSHGKPQ